MYAFGELLRGFRQREGMTQRELADRLGVHRRTVSDWERSEYLPRTREMVLDLAETLGLSHADTDRLLIAAEYPAEHLPEAEAIITPSHQLALGAPKQAPPLPEHFIPRPEISDTLRDRLLEEGFAPGVLVVSAIHGLGGIGKSVLAAALAHDAEVQERFPDGVLWVTLGQQPELHSLLSSWIVSGLRDRVYRPTTIEAASAHLRTLLLDRAVLLVIDDVWEAEHARPFLAGSHRCRVLITTRRADVADEVGADLQQMDVMTPLQSLDLLAARLGRPLGDKERQDARRLARMVGHLPLALELAATRVKRGMSWIDLCTALEEEVARLEVLDSARRRRKRATRVVAAFNLSLEALRTDDEEAWEAFIWLGVLQEDVTVAAPMAATLWGVSEAKAVDLLELLWNDSLLLPDSPLCIGKNEWAGYRLHDLLHDVARRLLTTRQPHGLGYTLKGANAAFLERYRMRTEESLWHTLPDDGYIHNHLAWHLEQALLEKEVHGLLQEETCERRSGWYEARERLGQTAGYVADVNRAWRLAENQFGVCDSPMAVGYQIRYALIIASLNSMAGNLPRTLLAALARRGLWPQTQLIAYARLVPNPSDRAVVLATLASHLSEPHRKATIQEAVEAVDGIEDELTQVSAWARLADCLPGGLDRERLETAWAVAGEIEDVESRAQALGVLIPHLPAPVKRTAIQQALASVQAIKRTDSRAKAILCLAPHLSESLLREELENARASIRSIKKRAARMDFTTEAFDPERADEEARTPSLVLVGLTPQLAALGYPEEAFEIVQEITGSESQAQAIADLAPLLSGTMLVEALEIVRSGSPDLQYEGDAKGYALVTLARRLQGSQRQAILVDALDIVRSIREPSREKALVLAEIASCQPEPLRNDAMLDALNTALEPWEWSLSERAAILAELAGHLPRPLRDQALRETLTIAENITSQKDRVEALSLLPTDLPDELLREALELMRRIVDDEPRVETFVELASRLPEPMKQEALMATLEEAKRLPKISERFSFFLGPYCREDSLERLSKICAESGHSETAQEAALEMERESDRDRVLLEVASILSQPRQLRQAEPKAARPSGDSAKAWLASLNLSSRTREDLLCAIRNSVPTIIALGGNQAIEETFRAVQDVCRWWP
jgi:transcriptional regulator with XRE-family HTH domain